MRLLTLGDVRTADRTEPGDVRPARHEPRRRRPAPHRPARRVLRAAGRAAGAARSWSRARACTQSDWPYERAPLAERCRDGWAVDRRRLPRHGALVIAVARPRRRAGLVGVQPARAVGAVAGAGGEHARGAEVDGGRATSPPSSTASRARGRARRRRRMRRRRDQRRPAQPRPPVPLRAHEPARRRVGSRSDRVRRDR